jgi:RNA polymerase sigma-70 factor (ECF subfamily)
VSAPDSILLDDPVNDTTSWLEQPQQQGDMRAFGSLYERFEPRLLRQAILLGADASLAEDLVQETFVEAWKCLSRYNGQCQFFTWLCAILHNRYRNFARRKRLLSMWSFAVGERVEREDASDQQPDPQAWPDEAAQLRDEAALVRRCIQSLPAKQQQVIYLRFFVDDSLEGIAAALRCSLGTVKSRLFHSLEKLRRMPALRERGGSPGPDLKIL